MKPHNPKTPSPFIVYLQRLSKKKRSLEPLALRAYSESGGDSSDSPNGVRRLGVSESSGVLKVLLCSLCLHGAASATSSQIRSCIRIVRRIDVDDASVSAEFAGKDGGVPDQQPC
jgi:hypothetical protein